MALRNKASGCTFDIIMPPAEHESFKATLIEDFDAIAKCLCAVDLAKSEASVAADKTTIFAMVQQSMGFGEVGLFDCCI